MPVCKQCERTYDNGTNGLHACDSYDRIEVLERELRRRCFKLGESCFVCGWDQPQCECGPLRSPSVGEVCAAPFDYSDESFAELESDREIAMRRAADEASRLAQRSSEARSVINEDDLAPEASPEVMAKRVHAARAKLAENEQRTNEARSHACPHAPGRYACDDSDECKNMQARASQPNGSSTPAEGCGPRLEGTPAKGSLMSGTVLIDMQSRTFPLEATGNHVHSCPLCYEHVPCEATCAVEPDLTLDDGTLRGHHHTCDECSEGAR